MFINYSLIYCIIKSSYIWRVLLISFRKPAIFLADWPEGLFSAVRRRESIDRDPKSD